MVRFYRHIRSVSLLLAVVTCVGCSGDDSESPEGAAAQDSPKVTPKARVKTGLPGKGTFALKKLLISDDCGRVAVGTNDKTQVWGLAGAPKKLAEVEGRLLALSPDGKYLVSAVRGVPHFIDVDSGKELAEVKRYTASEAFFLTPTRVLAFTISYGAKGNSPLKIREYEVTTGELTREHDLPNGPKVKAASHLSGGRLFVGYESEKRVVAWDFERNSAVSEVRPADPELKWVSFDVSPDGKWLLFDKSGPDPILDSSGKPAASVPEKISSASLAFVPDRDAFVAPTTLASKPNNYAWHQLALFDIQAKKITKILTGGADDLTNTKVSADGRTVIASDGTEVLVWGLD